MRMSPEISRKAEPAPCPAPSSSSFILPTPGSGSSSSSGIPPNVSPASGALSERTNEDAQKVTSAAFNFPFPTAYGIQIDLMRSIFRALEDGKVGVFESPTGTGKSLSLICGAFTWLRLHAQRAQRGEMTSQSAEQSITDHTAAGPGADDEPDWVVAHDAARRRAEMTAHEEELRERIQAVREREARLIHRQKMEAQKGAKARGSWQPRKKQKLEDDGDESDSGFLASEYESGDEGGRGPSARPRRYFGPAMGQSSTDEEDSNLSPAVRALMAELDATRKANNPHGPQVEEEEPETTPKIFYASRTHSQLSQFVSELRKTVFGRDVQVRRLHSATNTTEDRVDGQTETVRVVSLGSRKQMCINESVQKLGKRAGAEAMNERCLELAKGGDSKKARCEYLPAQDEAGQARMLDFRDHALAKVQDIEDVVELGKEMHTCPYYGARRSARQAELITLPYNLLLHPDARASLNVSFKDSIIIIDEAHNLIDTILSTHTVSVTSVQISQAGAQIDAYLSRFRDRLKGSNEMHLREVRATLTGLERFCARWVENAGSETGNNSKGKAPTQREEIITAGRVVEQMGGNLDQINLVKLERYLKDSQIARKISGYADKQAQRALRAQHRAITGTAGNGNEAPALGNSAISAMHVIESFILSLANRTEDGRVLLSTSSDWAQRKGAPVVPAKVPPVSKGAAKGQPGLAGKPEKTAQESKANVPTVTLKYQLLNPANAFRELVDEARAVVLAGGTMEPISDFRTQLLPTLPAARFSTFSCGHIIPPSNLLAAVVPVGPRGTSLEFKFENRKDIALLDDLGNALANFCNVVPHGIVVFLPSYVFLDTVHARWSETGTLKRISAKKKVFSEPKEAANVDAVLREYTLSIDAPEPGGPNGALLLAVVGAKLSEGINFSDRLARGVVMIGMPFANATSPDLAERMRYVRELARKQPQNTEIKAVADPGSELYINLCMKAVNQSIGRAIRHKNDYAALLLLDRRYGRPDIKSRLPGWIREEVKVHERFGSVIGALGGFFRDKRK